MMPCSPPIAFCSTVGHAILQTAGAIGPSTRERSSLRAAGVPGAAAVDLAGAPGVMSDIDPVAASAADGADGGGGDADTDG